jgi:hypothetical protein
VSVALGIQHAMRRSHIIIRSLPDRTIFLDIITQMARFSKNVIEHKMCVSIFSKLLSVTFLVRRITEQGMIKNVYWPLHKVPIICISVIQVSVCILTSQESLEEYL